MTFLFSYFLEILHVYTLAPVALNFAQGVGASCVALIALRALRNAGNRPLQNGCGTRSVRINCLRYSVRRGVKLKREET